MDPLWAVVLTFNEEAGLPNCLESLKGLTTQILVCDSGSTDGTVAIAEGAGAQVVVREFDNYGAQRNWAQDQISSEAGWVLHLDADESLTPELRHEIKRYLVEPPVGVDGFLLRRRTVFMGRWIKHGAHYPSYHLRLFRIGAARCEDRLYDQHFMLTTDGGLKKLQNDFIDNVSSDLITWSQRHSRWADLEAREILRNAPTSQVRPRFWGSSIERKRWQRRRALMRLPPFFRPFVYWMYRYFFRLGFLDGKPGLIFHFLQGFWFRFLVDARLYELRTRELPDDVG